MYDDDYGLRDIHDDDLHHVHDLLYVYGYVYDRVPRDAYAPHGDNDVHDDRVDAYDGHAYVLRDARALSGDGAHDDAYDFRYVYALRGDHDDVYVHGGA